MMTQPGIWRSVYFMNVVILIPSFALGYEAYHDRLKDRDRDKRGRRGLCLFSLERVADAFTKFFTL
jgi:hypothetical protein